MEADRGESRWAGMKGSTKGMIKGNKQAGGMRTEPDKFHPSSGRKGTALRFDVCWAAL